MNQEQRKSINSFLDNYTLLHVRRHPKSSTKSIFLKAIDKNPFAALSIFSQSLDVMMSTSDLKELEKALENNDVVAGKKIAKNGIISFDNYKCMRIGVMRDVKKRLSVRNESIVGASTFGQIHEKDMTQEDAAEWMKPQLARMKNESPLWQRMCTKMEKSKLKKAVRTIKLFSEHIRDQELADNAYESVKLFFKRP